MANSLAHTKWVCKYHIVFTPKYRRKIIYNQLRADIQTIIKDLCKWKGVEIIEGNMMPDHIHLLLSIPPKYSVSNFMGYLKGKSAMMIFERHGNLKYKFGNRNFWATGYYVSTVGLNTATIQKYIREQDKMDQMEDSLSKKEYVDPFKGSKQSYHLWLEQSESQRHLGAGLCYALIGLVRTTPLRGGSDAEKTDKNSLKIVKCS